MTLEEAFYKQKEELRAANREIASLKKKLEAAQRSNAADETVLKQLSQIRGLKNKVSEYKGIAERYQSLYEAAQKRVEILSDDKFSLELEVSRLRQRLEFVSGSDTSQNTSLKEAEEKIKALSDEVARLAARLNTNGTNAGIPTSKTPIGQKKVIPNSRKSSGKSRGGQPGHPKHDMKSFEDEEITDFTDHSLADCPKCGSINIEEVSVSFKDEFDYEVKVIKRRHRFAEYTCLDCGEVFRAPLGSLVASNQYGKTVQAMALSLMNQGFVSINRLRRILSGFSPEPISLSDGYLIKLQKRFSKKLASFVSDVKACAVGLPILYWDDTVIFVNTARACMRFYGDEHLALYTAHKQKDLTGITEDNILPMLSAATTVMHDHNTINYRQEYRFKNIECLQHLERDLTKLEETSHHRWAKELLELIKSTIHRRKLLIKEGVRSFSTDDVQDILCAVDRILADGYKEYIRDLGRYFENDEKKLLNRLEAYKSNYFAWVEDFSLPTTNNLSERSLRFIKTKDKVSGQFQSIEYAKYFADIRTYLETCARNGVNEFTALVRLTSGNPYTVAELMG